jgi:hypothetical protein
MARAEPGSQDTGSRVLDGKTGLLVPPMDPSALADGVTTILRDLCMLRTFGEQARERTQRSFSVDTMVRDYELLFRRLLADSTRAARLSVKGWLREIRLEHDHHLRNQRLRRLEKKEDPRIHDIRRAEQRRRAASAAGEHARDM